MVRVLKTQTVYSIGYILTRRGIAYAYSDKYRKKTLRLGDLLHLKESSVQQRLHTMLDAKNMELAGCYHQ